MSRLDSIRAVLSIAVLLSRIAGPVRAQEAPVVGGVELQPLAAQVERLRQALELLGAPFSAQQREKLSEALSIDDPAKAVRQIQAVIDPLCLAYVDINPESRVKTMEGPAPAVLIEKGWRVFLVKVHNQAGVTATLHCNSPNAVKPFDVASSNDPEPPRTVSARDIRDRWLDLGMYHQQPLKERLSGLELEYRILELYSRDSGKREAKLQFDVGQGTDDVGFGNEVNVLFQCDPAITIALEVLDDDGQPTMAQFTIRDRQQRVYPARSRRLAPDFFFHDQIYRADGESIILPPGDYEVACTRGPEYEVERRAVTVRAGESHRERFQLRRWIDMAKAGWHSGDHHVHAAGCAHYAAPTQGVNPKDMMRHILGEDLNVGCVLTWGPCWYHQKQFFAGGVNSLSTDANLMRYDVEVSGFPSSHAGHLVLLRLSEDDYPGTSRIEEWPSWDLPILQWAKGQNGVVGFAHSGWGLQVDSEDLPNYELPAFDGIGANEYIVDVTHGVCDMISTIDTPAVDELNIWYHTLNCGFTTRISGETDFPCIYDERVGLGRVYVKTPQDQSLDFDGWVNGLRDGRSYCSEGRCHLFDFQVNELNVGEAGADGRPSVLSIPSGDKLRIQINAAALLGARPDDEIRGRGLRQKPYWHVEKARVGETRTVNVELVVNGRAVAEKPLTADGHVEKLAFDYAPKQSSWVALRVFPAAHTNPVFVEIDGKPIRASKRSAEWCLKSVDRCWESKSPRIREEERQSAAEAYEHARIAYRRIFDQAFDDRTHDTGGQ